MGKSKQRKSRSASATRWRPLKPSPRLELFGLSSSARADRKRLHKSGCCELHAKLLLLLARCELQPQAKPVRRRSRRRRAAELSTTRAAPAAHTLQQWKPSHDSTRASSAAADGKSHYITLPLHRRRLSRNATQSSSYAQTPSCAHARAGATDKRAQFNSLANAIAARQTGAERRVKVKVES